MHPPTSWSGGVGDQFVGEQQLDVVKRTPTDFSRQSPKGYHRLRANQWLRATGTVVRRLGANQTTLGFRKNISETTN